MTLNLNNIFQYFYTQKNGKFSGAPPLTPRLRRAFPGAPPQTPGPRGPLASELRSDADTTEAITIRCPKRALVCLFVCSFFVVCVCVCVCMYIYIRTCVKSRKSRPQNLISLLTLKAVLNKISPLTDVKICNFKNI